MHPSFFEAFKYWVKLGWISFGGPTGQIAIMHHDLVEEKKWISEERFLHALNYCMLLPGPEAQQLAIYIGWLLHRTWGGIVAGSFFVIPSIFILITLSWIYVTYGETPNMVAVFYGLKASVLAIVAHAVIRIGQKALKNGVMVFVALAAFVAIYFLKVPFPLIILAAGLIGLAGGKIWPEKFYVIKGQSAGETSAVLADKDPPPEHARPSTGRAITVLVVCGVLWIFPLIGLGLWRGFSDVLFQEGAFFSKAAMVTFGGAYAVLPYIAQQGVQTYHWLSAPQMIDGLGLAETTPGPLIMVVAFLGYLGAWSQATALSPALGGILGGLTATYFTFLPSFLWIFLGAPYIEKMRGNVKLTSALSAITAAVVGVVCNLAVFFGLHVLSPGGESLDVIALLIAGASFLLLWRYKWNLVGVILASMAFGWLIKQIVEPLMSQYF